MLLICTPGVLASHLLAAIAVVDSVSLGDLWSIAKEKLTTETIDNFQKNIIWRSLASQRAEILFTVHIDQQIISSPAELTYGSLLQYGTEENIYISPTEKCKYLYLTGTTNYQNILTTLGEKPLELLGVIARHGSQGIVNGVLAQKSNQDIRSIGVRLQKLEAAGLIVCCNVYVDKKHTNQSIHVRFAPKSLLAKQNADVEEDIHVSRDPKRLRQLIIDALKKSSNQMRGFSDLRKDLKLEGSVSEGKFFKAVCNKLHHGGFIEKLHVELPQTKQRVYAMRLIKDLNTADDNENERAIGNSNEEIEEDNQNIDTDLLEAGVPGIKDEFSDDELEPVSSKLTPCFNLIFPPFHQMFQQILSRGEAGMTHGEMFKILLGTSEYRPFCRVFEQLPTYLSNSKTLKHFKKYPEPYDDYSVAKLYDHEGKVKFYRYYVTRFCKESKPKPKNYSLAPKPNKLSLLALEKKLNTAVGRISSQSLLQKRERLLAPLTGRPIESLPPSSLEEETPVSKKRGRKPKLKNEDLENDLGPSALAQLAIDEQGPRPKRTRRAVSYTYVNSALVGSDSDDAAFEPEKKSEVSEAEETSDMDADEDEADNGEDQAVKDQFGAIEASGAGAGAKQEPILKFEATISPDLVNHDLQQRKANSRKRRPASKETLKPESSLSSQKRRDELLKILAEEGGAAIITGVLRRKLDTRLDKSTETDSKTLFRDIAALAQEGLLESSTEYIGPEGKQSKRTLLVLTSHKSQLNESRMDAVLAKFAEESLTKRKLQRRIIESELNLHVEKPRELADIKLTTRRREQSENRLKSVDEAAESKALAKATKALAKNNVKHAKPESADVFDSLKMTRKARKVVLLGSADSSLLTTKRPRRSLKLEKLHATTIYRAVIIHRAFSKDAIDFTAIAALIGESDGALIRRKWSTLRRLFGGAEAVNKGVEAFQNMVLQGIEEGEILAKDLSDPDPIFFLEFWKRFDLNAELSAPDEMPLYASYALNEEKYDLEDTTEIASVDLAEKIEETSMRQKEGILANTLFTFKTPTAIARKDNDELRSILKSILCIDVNDLNSAAAKEILGKFDPEDVQKTADQMIRDKEILLVSIDDEKKFVLSERFLNTMNSKVFTEKFFHDAETFRTLACDISKAEKGLIISPGITSGEMASLLQLISENNIKLVRIDRTLKFENYESRLIDREQISCDIIVHGVTNISDLAVQATSPVPILGPCKPLWANLKATINLELWAKIIIILLYHIVFKPGVSMGSLFAKLDVIFSADGFERAIHWLIENKCIVESDDSLTVTHNWQYILGK